MNRTSTSTRCVLSIAALVVAAGAARTASASIVYDSTNELSTIHYMPFSLVYSGASGNPLVGIGDRASLMSQGALDSVDIVVQRRVATQRIQEFTLSLYEAPQGPSSGNGYALDLIASQTQTVTLNAYGGPSSFQTLNFDFGGVTVPSDVVWMLTVPNGDQLGFFDIVVPLAGSPERGDSDAAFAWEQQDDQMDEFVYPYNPGDLPNNFGAVFTLSDFPRFCQQHFAR